MKPEHATENWEAILNAAQFEVRQAHLRLILSGASCLAAVLLLIGGLAARTAGQSSGLGPFSSALFLLLLCALNMCAAQRSAFDRLPNVDSVQAIGPLLNLLPKVSGGKKKLVLATLARLLPQVQTGDAVHFRSAHRRQLRTTLTLGDYWQEPAYPIGILKALEQIGDQEDLKVMERLASEQGDTWQEQQIREAARACLPGLREQAALRKQRDHLLRPAASNTGGELLHPAMSADDPAPMQLLRPIAGEEKTSENAPRL